MLDFHKTSRPSGTESKQTCCFDNDTLQGWLLRVYMSTSRATRKGRTILIFPWSRNQRYIVDMHRSKKLFQKRLHAFFYCQLYVFLCAWKLRKELTRALSMDMDRTMAQTHAQARSEANRHIVHRSFTKKIKQDMADNL